ncbi:MULTISPECIES: hypothetical protein [Cohnella]|uniref:hypothetical protein n=1 Tax=Cohnella TaxID=329857 RepID=UPI001593B61F|nr:MULTISPECIES: hypothetical protein [Cohnella]MBN2983536.1 hypothetical protein [Cohnella algarum]
MRKYYLGYNGQRVGEPMQRDEATRLLFATRRSVKGLCLLIYDEKNRLIRQIPKKLKR